MSPHQQKQQKLSMQARFPFNVFTAHAKPIFISLIALEAPYRSQTIIKIIEILWVKNGCILLK